MLAVACLALVAVYNPDGAADFLNARKLKSPDEFVTGLSAAEQQDAAAVLAQRNAVHALDQSGGTSSGLRKTPAESLHAVVDGMTPDQYSSAMRALPLASDKIFVTGWEVFKHLIPLWLFFIVTSIVIMLCWMKNLSLIPVLGLISCFYLMSELGFTNWMRFLIWLAVGLTIYFTYSRTHSHLSRPA
jgi:hypothetical protein